MSICSKEWKDEKGKAKENKKDNFNRRTGAYGRNIDERAAENNGRHKKR